MSNIWNPHAFGVTGEPVTPQTNQLRVYGAEPTKEQFAMAQQTFAKFCMTARLSAVPNPMEQGWLPDGSKYRIVTVGNVRIMEMVLEGAESESSARMFHGILRVAGEVEVGGEWLLHEFRANGEQYVDTAELYGDFHDIKALGTYSWNAFNRTNLSGAAALLAQFGRGAHVAYSEALKDRANKYSYRDMGDGVFVGTVTENGVTKKAVYFFRDRPGVGIVVRRGEVLSGGELGIILPQQIEDLFGGAPLPPTESEWANAYVVVEENAIQSAAGVTPGNYSRIGGTPLLFPTFATAAGSKEAYFTFTERKWHEDGPGYGYYLYSILLKATFPANPLHAAGVVSAASSKGIYEFAVVPSKMPDPSTHQAVIGVTHVAGALTTFRREIIFDHYDLENGTPFVKIVQQVREYWSGGSSGSVLTQKYREWKSASGSQTGTVTHSWVEVSTNHFSGPADGLPEGYYGWETTARERMDWSGTGDIAYSEEPRTGLGEISTFAREGVFQVAKGSRIPYTETCSASCSSWSIGPPQGVKNWVSWAQPPMPNIPFDASSTTEHPYDDTLIPSSGHNSFKYGGLCLWVNGIGRVRTVSEVKTYALVTDKQIAFATLGFIPLAGESDDSGSSGTYTQTLQKQEGLFASETLHANGPSHNIPSMTILEKFEDADRIKEIKESARFGFDSPISFINRKYRPFETPGVSILFNISQLGGHQCLYTIASTATKGLSRYAERYDMGWGSLVNNAYDIHYSPISIPGSMTHFIGQLQP